jgi:predicted metal-dependent HD superfamily phosphohydrolase
MLLQRNRRMNAREQLSDVWRDLTLHQARTGPAAQAVLDELVQAYSEPHRHYHTIKHVTALLQLLDKHGRGVLDRNAVALAILFHDVIYDPARHDNEQASADLASDRLAPLGFPDQLIAKVKGYILATRHGESPPTINEGDLALLLDLDLSILAAPPSEYHTYAQAIRREYAHVPDVLYRLGRRRILEGFLARERIYQTEQLRVLWDERARTNMAAEIAGLV